MQQTSFESNTPLPSGSVKAKGGDERIDDWGKLATRSVDRVADLEPLSIALEQQTIDQPLLVTAQALADRNGLLKGRPPLKLRSLILIKVHSGSGKMPDPQLGAATLAVLLWRRSEADFRGLPKPSTTRDFTDPVVGLNHREAHRMMDAAHVGWRLVWNVVTTVKRQYARKPTDEDQAADHHGRERGIGQFLSEVHTRAMLKDRIISETWLI